MNGIEALNAPLSGFCGVCLLVAMADALFDEGAEGLRLACGLGMALYILRIAVEIL